jgi:hypothetical protein
MPEKHDLKCYLCGKAEDHLTSMPDPKVPMQSIAVCDGCHAKHGRKE